MNLRNWPPLATDTGRVGALVALLIAASVATVVTLASRPSTQDPSLTDPDATRPPDSLLHELDLALASVAPPCEGKDAAPRAAQLGAEALRIRQQSRLVPRESLRPLTLFDEATACARSAAALGQEQHWSAHAESERTRLRRELRVRLLRIERLLQGDEVGAASRELVKVQTTLSLAAGSALYQRLQALRYQLPDEESQP